MNAIEELSVEIKVLQAEIELMTKLSKQYNIKEIKQDIDERNKKIAIMRDKYFNLI